MLDSGGWEPEPKQQPAGQQRGDSGQKKPRRILEQGADAPNFNAQDQYGRTVRGQELSLSRGAVLVFVPDDQTDAARSVYTWAETNRQTLSQQSVELLLVVPHTVETAYSIDRREKLRVAILADANEELAGQFGFKGYPKSAYTFAVSGGSIQLASEGLVSGSDLLVACITKPGERSEGLFDTLFSE